MVNKKNNGDGQSVEPGKPFIVAIGASAGGVQALQAFIGSLPANTGAAYVVVVHLDPQRRSELPSILAARTRMPVTQVVGKQKLAADHVYVIPPDRRLQMIDHEVSAVEFEQPHGQRSPIDQFFRSVAERIGDGFAVVLSGAGSDGAIGVRAVKEAGGIILVQDPDEAEWASMPRSVIATGVADFVLPARDLAQRLADLLRIKQSSPIPDEKNFDEELLRRILAHLRVRTGHDFSKYKQSTVVRRIARRMQVTRTDELKEYYDFLRENADEPQALLADLLISVTTFFRDTEVFNTMAKAVLPNLFKDKENNPSEPVRVWVCGCATGEEAYTLAMLLLEEVGRHEYRPPIQIFGSDLDARALASAREARYPAAIEADVNEERLRRFFTQEGDRYRVRQEVRDTVLFAVHDLLKDPPFSHVDLISCRNVLIYLDRELQEQVCNTFHYALNPGGYLLVGSSETADYPPGLFRVVDRPSRIYQSTAQVDEKPRLVPRLLGPVRVREPIVQYARGLSPTAALGDAAVHRRAIEEVAPPSILVDEAHRVIHLSDHAGRYLMPSGGPLSGDIGDLARPELRFELRSSLNRAFEQNVSTLSLPIAVRFNGSPHRVHLLVKPSKGEGVPRHALVIFIEGEAIGSNVLISDQQATDETVRRLTQELELTQSRLRTVAEESDAANEELRAANEELQSINEEYRSTSEELETSKEELQSINEELQTVNTELKLKLDAISRAHSDLQNLMAATDFGTLFLDTALRIKRFTDRVTDLFSITPADEGRPITDFAHQLEHPDLIKDARTVLADLAPIRREVRSRADRWYDVRLRPYRTVDDRIDGVVITFVDISDRRQIEEALRASEQHLLHEKQLIDLSREPILVWDLEGGILQWNRGCEEFYGFKRMEAIGQPSQSLLGTTVPGSSFEQVKSTLRERGSWRGELIQRTRDGRELTVDSRLELVAVEGHRLVFESARDITERKQLEQQQRLLLRELNHRVKNTLAVVQAIAHQTLRSAKSNKEFVQSFEGRIAAMGSAHDLLARTDWMGADLASLAREQLKPYISDGSTRVQIEGPPVLLPPSLASPFGFVIYELATNAAKYGAWSAPTGRVSLNWSLLPKDQTPSLKFVWEESGGPPVNPPTGKGFGSILVEQGIPQARVKRDFNPAGVVCTIEVPLLSAPET
jgi:two-component system, chemotaxis family, CheB/CheR fusion protein